MPIGYGMSGIGPNANAQSAVAYNMTAYLEAKSQGLNVTPEQFGLGLKIAGKFGYSPASAADKKLSQMANKNKDMLADVSGFHTVPINNSKDYTKINSQRGWARATGANMPIADEVLGGPTGWTPPPPPPPEPEPPVSVPLNSKSGYTPEPEAGSSSFVGPEYKDKNHPDIYVPPVNRDGTRALDSFSAPEDQMGTTGIGGPQMAAETAAPAADPVSDGNNYINSSFAKPDIFGQGWQGGRTKLVGTSAIEMTIHNIEITQKARDRLLFAFNFEQMADYELQFPPTTMTYNAELGRCLSRQANGSGVYVDD